MGRLFPWPSGLVTGLDTRDLGPGRGWAVFTPGHPGFCLVTRGLFTLLMFPWLLLTWPLTSMPRATLDLCTAPERGSRSTTAVRSAARHGRNDCKFVAWAQEHTAGKRSRAQRRRRILHKLLIQRQHKRTAEFIQTEIISIVKWEE